MSGKANRSREVQGIGWCTHGGCVRRASAGNSVHSGGRSARAVPAPRSGQTSDRRPRSRELDDVRGARGSGHRHRGRALAAWRAKGQPRAAPFGREPGKAVDLAGGVASGCGRGPAQHRAQRRADRGARDCGRSGAHAGSQGDRRQCAAGGTAVHPVRRLRAGSSGRGSARRSFPSHGAQGGAGEPAGTQRSSGHRLHFLHLRHHQPPQDRGLRPLRLLAQRIVDAGMSRAHRGRPHVGVSLVRLELGAGAEPYAVPAKKA